MAKWRESKRASRIPAHPDGDRERRIKPPPEESVEERRKAMPQRRVLIVDDALFMRNTLRDIFTSAGFAVTGEADDGVPAVNLFRELKPDLVTMDIVMPCKSGIDATREIVQLDPGAVVIMCSVLGQESLVMEAIEAGATDFIVKPFRGEDVLAVVKKVLGE